MIHANELLGKTVIEASGKYIGEVEDLDIDKKTWQVSHLHVKLSNEAIREFGVKKILRHPDLHIPTSIVKEIGAILTLNQTFGELKKTYSPFDKSLEFQPI